MKLNLNERKGKKLIVLIIIIIVLLILAGVSISILTGQNGILTQANNVKTSTANKSAEEKIPVKKYETKTLTASDIAGMTDKTKIYGATVTGYTLPAGTTTDVNWKIFYADSNIYLIADNYVERTNLPYSTTAGTKETITTRKPNDGDSSTVRAAYFSDILLKDYAGSARIKDSKLKALNNDYFNTKNYTSTNPNMKSIAYIMDTAAWETNFKDTNSKADYVIGGPTVELLFKSYNDKYKTAFESQAVETSDKNNTGYQIRKASSDSWANQIRSMLKNGDPLYVIAQRTDSLAYWLASPSANYTYSFPYYVMYVSSNGDVTNGGYKYNFIGFRPLVCLNSEVKLQKVSDTQYAIQ